jgi:glutamine synthetase
MKPDEALEKILEDRFRWIDICYTDVMGNFKIVTIPSKKLSNTNFKEGVASIDHESMFYTEGEHITLIPDSNSYAPIPWEPSTARFIASSNNQNDPRNILTKASQLFEKETKSSLKIGSEVDFYLVDTLLISNEDKNMGITYDSRELNMNLYKGEMSNAMRRYQSVNGDLGRSIRMQVGEYAEIMDVNINSHNHEKGRIQHEIAMEKEHILKAADDMLSIKYITKNSSMIVGAITSFSPMISDSEPSNKVHINMSAWQKNENKFASLEGEKLSETGYYFAAGIMEHINSLSAFLLPSTLSYKKMSHVDNIKVFNRIMRLPTPLFGEEDKRIEYRLADPSMNPYLGYSAIMLAGLDGIKKKMNFDEKKVIRPPTNLTESLSSLMQDSEYLQKAFSDNFINNYIELKENEVKEKSSKINVSEVTKYLNI